MQHRIVWASGQKDYLRPASLSSPLSSESSPSTPSGPRGYPCTPSAARRSLPPNNGFRKVLSRIFHRAPKVLFPVLWISLTLCRPHCHGQQQVLAQGVSQICKTDALCMAGGIASCRYAGQNPPQGLCPTKTSLAALRPSSCLTTYRIRIMVSGAIAQDRL